jgi:hypothetical protein
MTAAQARRPARLGTGGSLAPRWVPWTFAGLSAALLPVIVRNLSSVPTLYLASHWNLAWGGFDVGLACLLIATGLALFRRSSMAQVLAAMTTAMICCDVWLDVLSSVGHGLGAIVVSMVEAAFAEIPLAVLFAWVAVRFARVMASAWPALCGAGFVVHRGRLLGPDSGHCAEPAVDIAGASPGWGQWTYRGRGKSWLLPWWLPAACFGLALVLIPWIVWLFLTLPQRALASHWDVGRAAFAAVLALALAASALALFRRWASAEVLVAMAAAVLLRDAWFNVVTAGGRHEAIAIALAAGLEMPMAALCLWVAVIHARAVSVAWPFVRSMHLGGVTPPSAQSAGCATHSGHCSTSHGA